MTVAPDVAPLDPGPPPRGAFALLLRRPLAVLGLAVILLTVLGALLAPVLTPYDPAEQFFDGLTLEGAPLGPNAAYLLGTDLLGRDLFTRILFGARTSLLIGVAANGMALLLGTLVGVTAGYARGWAGAALMRFTDLMMAFPALLLAICLAAIFQPSLWIVALVIALVTWVQTARVLYAETTALAERDFIAAERAIGAGHARILWHHVLPHLVPTIIVWGTLGISTTVLLEATLSFLGIGLQPPVVSWGIAINDAAAYLRSTPHMLLFPAAFLSMTVLAFIALGDVVREALDPKTM